MNIFKNIIIYSVLLVIAVIEGNFIHYWIASEYVLNKTFDITFNWIYWSLAIFWAHNIVFFILLGFVLTSFIRTNKPLFLATLFGITYSAMRMSWSSFIFTEEADFWVYFWSYGEYLMPPVGSCLGALALIKLFRVKCSNKALVCDAGENPPAPQS